jgi:hypothetical protein
MTAARVEPLKRDHFGSISVVEVDGRRLIRRDTREASFGLRWIARRVAAREARALARLTAVDGVPRLLAFDGRVLDRQYLDGVVMNQARPRDPRYFIRARALLRDLHRAGVAHNDLAKEANWLVRVDGSPAVVDFQLAVCRARRTSWFRLLCHEDLRHFLKHKRTYCPERLTPIERRVLARRSWVARAWQATGKQVYILIARKILRWEDNEGRGRRHVDR